MEALRKWIIFANEDERCPQEWVEMFSKVHLGNRGE